MVVPENIIALSGRLPIEVLLNVATIGSNTTCETDIIRDSHTRLALPYNPLRISRAIFLCLFFVLLAWVRPVCHTGYGEQNRDGNGPETPASGGCNPGTDAFGALDSLERGYGPLRTHDSKRKRDRDPPLPSRSSTKRQSTRTFACPFYLRDRLRHSDCLNIRLTRLSDVRQHLLERAHNQVVHCPACGITFTGRTAVARGRRDVHVQAATCEPSPSPFEYPGITEDEEQRIREIARNTRTTQYTEVQRWYMIWDFLFPGAQRPDSPFLTDVPDIQRVVDWTDAIFDSDLWQALPNQPWTPTMRREEQRSGMSNFIHSFIAQARGLVGQNVAPAEDDHAADNSSYIEVETPAPSGATANLGVASLASFDSNPPADNSGRAYLSPVSATRSRQSRNPRRPGQVGSSTSELPADVAPIPSRPLDDPAGDVPQDMQQRTAAEGSSDIPDPTLPLLVLDDFSNYFPGDLVLEWPMISNDDARSNDNHPPTGEGEPGGHQ